jgi:ribosomal protein L9
MSDSEILKRIEALRREIEYLKRDLIQVEAKGEPKQSLFGSVSAEDITEEMIEEAKSSLFREMEDI